MRRAIPCAILACLVAAPAAGQAVRATGTTSLQFVTIRELIEDSVPVGTTRGSGLLRRSAEGTIVRCVEGDPFCRFVHSGRIRSTAPLVQDVSISAWGFGRGVRVWAQLRGRAGMGDEPELWPRAEDPFDVLVAYIELDRPRIRIRAGRQWKVSGLGYYNWDGASALVRPARGLSVEAFGGWSLARGLNEPLTGDALEAVEAFAPGERALLFGVQASWRPTPLAAIAALYQREIRSDRYGLYSERIAADGSVRRGRLRIEGTLEGDVALREIDDARLRASLALPRDLTADLFVRHYRPYFELWTIWGAFDPIGYTELGTTVGWQPRSRPIAAALDVAHRRYPDAAAATTFGSARSDGWRFGTTVTYRPDTLWLAQAAYHVDAGFGAGRNDLAIFVRRRLPAERTIGMRALLFERAFEFRVGNGRVIGAGVDASTRIGDRVRASLDAAIYRHLAGDDGPEVDWSQARAALRFEWTIGAEPGLPGRGTGAR